MTAIMPLKSDEAEKLKFHLNQGGEPERRGGRRNAPGGVLDRIKFIRISMLSDPALDAGRHEFEMRTLLGRILSPEDSIKFVREHGWIPPVREIYPLIIGGMSFGALSPTMWEGLQMGVAYLNEELGMPVRICTGEGGCPPRLLRSRFMRYVILQIASGYFGWDEIIHAIPEMKADPCAIEIKYGQGAKPGDGGPADVVQSEQAHRGHPRRSHRGQPAQSAHPSDQVLHRRSGGQDDPVHVHGLGVPGAGLSQNLRQLLLHLRF